jgi:Family of unknown function (DUF6057)
MIWSDKKNRFVHVSLWIQDGLFFLACFFYLLFKIHPVLILELQQPVFFKGADFLSESLRMPGGLVDLLSAFFMQFWFSNFLGALFLTLCFWLVALLTGKWIETLTKNRPIHTLPLIPAALLLILHGQYNFPLSIAIALIINLTFLNLYIRWAPKQQITHALLGLTISVLLYWFTGGAFFVFAVLSGLGDLLFQKKFAYGFLSILISIALPLMAFNYIFLVMLEQAYQHNLIFDHLTKLQFVEYCLPSFYLLTLIFFYLVQFAVIRKPFNKINKLLGFVKFSYFWKLAAGTLIMIGGTIIVAQKSCDETVRLALQINRSVREDRWSEVLELTPTVTSQNPLFSFQTNLALYQTDMLLDKMFAYPQTLGTLGLMMNLDWCDAWPEEADNLYWKLGLINESHHWATEAYELKGRSPDLLKRLGMIYMLKGAPVSANRFFLNLKKVPFHEKIAEDLIRLNANPSELAQDSECKRIQASMPLEDYISLGNPSYHQLEVLLMRNPRNKMTFEYLMAYYLLNANVKGIWDHISDFSTLNYMKIPRHIQEAMIIMMAITPNLDQNKLKGWIDPININRFMEYRQTLIKYKGDKGSAKQELQSRFGDSYWYYLMFVKPVLRQSESQREYH